MIDKQVGNTTTEMKHSDNHVKNSPVYLHSYILKKVNKIHLKEAVQFHQLKLLRGGVPTPRTIKAAQII